MTKRVGPMTAGVALLLFALSPPAVAADKPAPGGKATEKNVADEPIVFSGPIVVKMEEVPAFDAQKAGGSARGLYPRGQHVVCSTTPSKEVKAYPKLASKRAIYGSATFESGSGPNAAVTYHFVLDQSEPGKAGADKPAEKPKAKKKGGGRPAGPMVHFDRLYFDANHDRDLTNDPVLSLAKKSPFEGLPDASSMDIFDELVLQIDYGGEAGKRPFRIVPVHSGPDLVSFFPAVIRQGKLQLGGREYTVCLIQGESASGRFDRPTALLEVMPAASDSDKRPALVSGPLTGMRLVGNQYCTVSASPSGDRLTLAPYQGDLGVLEVGPGGRAITNLGVTGQLTSKTMTLPMGDSSAPSSQAGARRHNLPVGDYAPTRLSVDYGRLKFATRVLSDSYLAAAGVSGQAPPYGIQIRKDKPFMLEFSGRPAAVFLGPREGQVFKPGTAILIRVMLAEPSNGLMISGLWDTTRKADPGKPSHGGPSPYASLEPSIVVQDSQGKQVAEGKMPFG